MVDSKRGAISISYPTSLSVIIFLLETPPKIPRKWLVLGKLLFENDIYRTYGQIAININCRTVRRLSPLFNIYLVEGFHPLISPITDLNQRGYTSSLHILSFPQCKM